LPAVAVGTLPPPADGQAVRHLSRLLPAAALAAFVLCLASVTATAAVGGSGHGSGTANGNGSGNEGKGNATSPSRPAPAVLPPAVTPAPVAPAAALPPSQAKKVASIAAPTPAEGAAAAAAVPAAGGRATSPAAPAGAATAVPPAAPPVLGESMGLRPVDGSVQVRLPGSGGYAALGAAGSIPPGAVVDARRGAVLLRTALAGGGTQTAKVWGAVFEVRQAASGRGITDLVLRGGLPAGCRTGRAAVARAAAAGSSRPPARRKPGSGGLWAQDRHGRFRTRGRTSVATVRGTRWGTRETCAGTRTTVIEGAVDVFDLRARRTVRVRARHSYVARAAR
jgi:hypothetical protein